jgi:DNA polymerase-3 subunit delta'
VINKIYPWNKKLWEDLREKPERTPHAILLHGPQGIGKLALAEQLAQSLLCEEQDRARAPCGECDGCRWYLAGTHPDFRRIEPESMARRPEAEEPDDAAKPSAKTAKPSTEIKVEQIRALDDFLNLRSHRDGRRVTLVHPAEAMNPNAANALLKGLEEPPGRALFLLVSHRPARLLATVRSRCVAVPVPVPEPDVAHAWLESQGVKDARAWLAFASGAPLRALSHSQESGGSLMRHRQALGSGSLEALGAVNDRAQLEELAESLQKFALDKAMATYCGVTRFGPAKPSRQGLAWLRYARQMGRNRALASHPLNPRLFAAEMLREMPKE